MPFAFAQATPSVGKALSFCVHIVHSLTSRPLLKCHLIRKVGHLWPTHSCAFYPFILLHFISQFITWAYPIFICFSLYCVSPHQNKSPTEQRLCWVSCWSLANRRHSRYMPWMLTEGGGRGEGNSSARWGTPAFTSWSHQVGWGWEPCRWEWPCPQCWLRKGWRWGGPSRCFCDILPPSCCRLGEPSDPRPPQGSLCFKQTQRDAIQHTQQSWAHTEQLTHCWAWESSVAFWEGNLAQASKPSRAVHPSSSGVLF